LKKRAESALNDVIKIAKKMKLTNRYLAKIRIISNAINYE